VRTVLLRASAAALVLTWWIAPGMGLAALGVTWDADWEVVLEAGWGVLCTFGLGLPLLLAAVRPRLAGSALVQLSVVGGSLAVAVVAAREPEAWWFFALLAVQLPVLHLLGRGQAPIRRARHVPLLLLAALGAPGWLAYAWQMAAANRALHFDGDITMGVDHYAGQAALGLALVALPAAGGLGLADRRLLATAAGIMAGYLGFVAYSWVDRQGDLGEGWALAAMAWAGAVLLAAWSPSPGTRRVRLMTDEAA
jgi:hypothetical protein